MAVAQFLAAKIELELLWSTRSSDEYDYDGITAVTGQPTQWIVPRGSVP